MIHNRILLLNVGHFFALGAINDLQMGRDLWFASILTQQVSAALCRHEMQEVYL
jgi:hypothetical protein